MTDLTKITTPYGLLDEATRKALRDHGGPYEIFIRGGWNKLSKAFFDSPENVYRVKAAPPKPREVWFNEYDGPGFSSIWKTYGPYYSREDADHGAMGGRVRVLRFVEVIE